MTINRDCQLLHLFLNDCLVRYPDDLRGFQTPKFKYKKETPRLETFTDEEYELIRDYYIKNNNLFNWKIIKFLRHTGLRYPSELIKLKWKHIHFDENYFEVNDRKNPNQVIINSQVPLVKEVKEVLIELKSRPNISTGPEDFIFVNNKGKLIKNISLSFTNCLKTVGIKKKVSMYSHRHTFVTEGLKLGIPIKYLSLIVGHTEVKTVNRFYSNLKSQDIKDKYLDFFNNKQKEIILEKDDTKEPQTTKMDLMLQKMEELEEMIKSQKK